MSEEKRVTPTQALPLETFSDHFGIDVKRLERLGVFDPILERDSPLAINPKLLDETKTPELQHSHRDVTQRFDALISLLAQVTTPHSTLLKAADDLLRFPEFKGVSLGFSQGSGDGSGWGPTLRREMLKTGKELVDAGIRDPRIFELAGLFQENIGPDRISDMLGAILAPHLITYTQRICKTLRVVTGPCSDRAGAPSLPLYFNQENRLRYVILVPADILSDLPQVLTWHDIATAAASNEQVRSYLNKRLGREWRKRFSKSDVRRAITENPDLARQLLARYDRKRVRPYDFAADPKNAVRWLGLYKEVAREEPFAFLWRGKPTPQRDVDVVRKLLLHFKHLVQDTRLQRALYNGTRPCDEKRVQDIFFGIARTASLSNGFDISSEVDTGRGLLDFKFSRGAGSRILVEIKLASNAHLVDGLVMQLPAYVRAEQAHTGLYLVIDFGTGQSSVNLRNLRAAIAADSELCETIVCDAAKRLSASKLRVPKKP